MRRLAALVLAALTASAAHGASSSEHDRVLPIAVQTPYGFLFLHLPAWAAMRPPLRTWAFDTGATVTNNFIYSDNVGDYLATRTARAPMTEADFDAIEAANPGEDVYYFDGEVTTVYARMGTSVSKSFFVGGIVSVVGISGGEGMDGFVEGFHDAFGLGQAYRDVVTKGQLGAVIKIDDDSVSTSQYRRQGFADPVIYGIWSPQRPGKPWQMAVAAGVKIPLGSTDKILSTGSADFGASFAATGDWERWCVSFNFGVVSPGEVEFLPGLDTATMMSVSASLGYRFQTTSLWLQAQMEQSPLRHATDTPIGEGIQDVSFGVRFPLWGSARGYFAVTENLFVFDNSSDIGFHGGVTWRTGREF